MRLDAIHRISWLTWGSFRDGTARAVTVVGLGLLVASSSASHCADLASSSSEAVHAKASVPLRQQVVVADQLVMVIEASAGGNTPAERVDAINDRLVEIISTERLVPSQMRLAKLHGQTVIMVGKHLLTSVTTADAATNFTTVPVLAHFWLANLKRILPQARPATRLP